MTAIECVQQGNIFREQGKLEEALDKYNEAILIDPNYAEAYNHSGVVLFSKGMVSEATSLFDQALNIRPDYPEALSNKANLLMVSGDAENAITCYRKSLNLCPNSVYVRSNLLLSMNYLPDITQESIFRESTSWENHRSVQVCRIALDSYFSDNSRRIRIGYISPDYRKHSVSYFFEPLLRNHNRNKFEIFCYSDVAFPDETTRKLEAYGDGWRNIYGKSDDDVCDIILNDRVHILVDLAGHTGKNRLSVFIRKPAPIQISWLGYPNTTGLSTMDFCISDEIAEPEGDNDRFYSERILRLKTGFLCYAPPSDAPLLTERPNKINGYITFGSFNNITKISPREVEVWSQILNKVEDSVLVLKSLYFVDSSIRNRLLDIFSYYGIGNERIRLLQAEISSKNHLMKYSQIDVALDTFPYNGTTTTCEALWMGVPVITLRGERHAGRVGASILHRLGLDDLIAESVENYISIAEMLSNDRKYYNRICRDLRGRMLKSQLCDSYKFASSIENVFIRLWNDYRRSYNIS